MTSGEGVDTTDTRMRVLDLFSGIGGFSLGLERAGMRTVQFVEMDPFCRAVLAQHWPGVPIHDDIRTFHAPAGFADVLCGGFPCQDISVAGKGAGLAGARSGLWSEYRRLIGEVRPRFVVVENVAALLGRGLGDVLGDLAALGYDAEWHCIPASAVGAPHRRDRVWIVAYPIGPGRQQVAGSSYGDEGAHEGRPAIQADRSAGDGQGSRSGDVAGPGSERQLQPRGPLIEIWRWLGDGREALAHADSERRDEVEQPKHGGAIEQEAGTATVYAGLAGGREWWKSEPDVGRVAHGVPAELDGGRCGRWPHQRSEALGEIWRVEPDIGRVAVGVPNRVDRLRSLGNAVVPQIPEIIGRAILRSVQA